MGLLLKTLIILTAFLASTALAIGPIFDARMDFQASNQIWKIVADDFNDDGILDIVTSHVQPYGTVSMNIGNGDGTFARTNAWMPIGLQCYFLTSADLNNDGYPDLAGIIKPAAQSQLAIYLNDGHGTFYGAVAGDTTYPWTQTISSYYDLDVLDVNNDGYIDVIYSSALINVMYNNGNGTFNTTPVAITEGLTAIDFKSADINHDEYMDIVCYGLYYLSETTYDTAMCTYINNGDGSFQSAVKTQVTFGQIISPDAGYGGFKLADMNDDDELDVVLLDENRTIMILLGDGAGSFTIMTGPQFDDGICYDVADIDGDGLSDVVVCDGTYTQVCINNGDGTVQTPIKYYNLPSSKNFIAVDLNNDGAADIAGGSWPGNLLSVILNHGDGSFAELEKIQMDKSLIDVTTGDFNNDNHLDFAGLTIIDGPETVISVRLGDGTGNFGTPIHTSGVESDCEILYAGDFDNNGNLDIAAAGTNFQTFSGNGDGTFAAYGTLHTDMIVSQTKIIGHDINVDDYMDLIFIAGTRYYTKLNNGDGTFGVATSLLAPGSNIIFSITFADINNDGYEDWIFPGYRTVSGSGSTTGSIVIYTTDAEGNIFYHSNTWSGGSTRAVVAIDIDSDGWLDLVTNHNILYNNGDGTIATFQSGDYLDPYPWNAPSEMKMADLDNDGRDDLIFGEGLYAGTSAMMTNGDGTFSNLQNYYIGPSPGAFLPGDFDEDGLIDLAIANQVQLEDTSQAYIAMLYNTGFGSGDCYDAVDYDADGIGDFCDNCPLFINAGQEDSNHDGIGDACQYKQTTPVGTDVEEWYASLGITLTFDEVTTEGGTEVAVSPYGPDGGGAFDLVPADLPSYFYFSTEAEFTGSIEICINYDADYMTLEEENDLALLHYEAGEWVDITTTHDAANNKICGTTDNLSPFTLGLNKPLDAAQQISDLIPDKYSLGQNYPNPFNPSTMIQFALPRLSKVEIEVYNILGQSVRHLVNEEKPAGQYQVIWNGLDNNGKSASSGIYFYKIKTNGFSSSKKMLLLK